MKDRKPITTWLLALGLGLTVVTGIAYADSTNWIFCSSFESPGVSCSPGVGPIEQISGPNGNLWDQMHWDSGTWQ